VPLVLESARRSSGRGSGYAGVPSSRTPLASLGTAFGALTIPHAETRIKWPRIKVKVRPTTLLCSFVGRIMIKAPQ